LSGGSQVNNQEAEDHTGSFGEFDESPSTSTILNELGLRNVLIEVRFDLVGSKLED